MESGNYYHHQTHVHTNNPTPPSSDSDGISPCIAIWEKLSLYTSVASFLSKLEFWLVTLIIICLLSAYSIPFINTKILRILVQLSMYTCLCFMCVHKKVEEWDLKQKKRATESKGDGERVKARLTDRMSTRVRNITASRCSSWSSKGGNRYTELRYFMNLPEPF